MMYTEEAIKGALMILNQIETRGIDNAKRIVQIEMILQNPIREETNDGIQSDTKRKG